MTPNIKKLTDKIKYVECAKEQLVKMKSKFLIAKNDSINIIKSTSSAMELAASLSNNINKLQSKIEGNSELKVEKTVIQSTKNNLDAICNELNKSFKNMGIVNLKSPSSNLINQDEELKDISSNLDDNLKKLKDALQTAQLEETKEINKKIDDLIKEAGAAVDESLKYMNRCINFIEFYKKEKGNIEKNRQVLNSSNEMVVNCLNEGVFNLNNFKEYVVPVLKKAVIAGISAIFTVLTSKTIALWLGGE